MYQVSSSLVVKQPLHVPLMNQKWVFVIGEHCWVQVVGPD